MIERFSLSYIVQGLGIDLVEVVSLTDIAVRVSSGGVHACMEFMCIYMCVCV